ncbi:MAG TPA: MBL fold metallo-hydrolase [Candidatus Thermoplasmatota archaeon]|nr:MBL fold metallo-hydrolase [Candidatus Thermoplasmatota archaeon]
MFEQVNETVRYVNAPTCIGVATRGEDALLVDSGLDENLARKVVNALANEGRTVRAVVNTHAHADHCGGNHFVVKRTGARVVAPAFEHYFIERPELEPYTLYGAPAPRALQGKFLRAQPSPVAHAVEEEGVVDVAGFQVRFHALPGHSVRQMGVEVDGVLFVGDAVLPPRVLEKHGLAFAVDPLEARRSTRKVLAHAGPVVAYHGGLLDDPRGAVEANVEAVAAAEARLLARLDRGPARTEDLVADLLDAFGGGRTLELHALHAATVRGYLAALEREGRVEAALAENHITWTRRRP